MRDGDKARLEHWVRSTSMPAGVVSRARLVWLASEGVANQDMAARVGMSRPTVNRWRNRYVAKGMPGLVDVKRPGRPRRWTR
jgi:transposase